MSERHWQRPALASTALALLSATAVAGCGGSASSSQASANQTAGAPTATATAQAQSLTAAQLKGALLRRRARRSWPPRPARTPTSRCPSPAAGLL